jgi:hypothetical protein
MRIRSVAAMRASGKNLAQGATGKPLRFQFWKPPVTDLSSACHPCSTDLFTPAAQNRHAPAIDSGDPPAAL